MLFQLPTSALLLALAVLAEASSHGQGAHLNNLRRRPLNLRGPQPADPIPARASLGRRSCRKTTSSSAAAAAATPVANLGDTPDTTTSTKEAAETTTTSSKAAAAPTGDVGAGHFVPTKPADWPTATQANAAPTAVRTSAADPFLMELSKAIDNSQNTIFTSVHNGEMTYYGQGLGACGDVYNDQSFTAAVSRKIFDIWPGADTAAQNRNPICGPFVPGRKTLNNAGLFQSAVKSSLGYAMVGGDGLLNCVGTTDPIVRCHVPLTATVTHGGKSIQVKIVDRCEDCGPDDIDLTPAAFAAIADPALGRTTVTWKFNTW